MNINNEFHWQNNFSKGEGLTVTDDDNTFISSLGYRTIDSRYCGNYISTLTIGGVNTDPQYRRQGYVRKMFDYLFDMAPSRSWVVSMLHPFNFSYYRKFGYEKICDHKIVSFPMSSISDIERNHNLKPLDSEDRLNDVISLYNEFGNRKNIMFPRHDGGMYNLDPSTGKYSTYIWYDDSGKPASYITLKVENEYVVNHMRSINLVVNEMVFTSPDSLRALFGFMRMYEGQNDSVKINNCAMSPEVDLILREFIGTDYELVGDIAARILDVKTILEANKYPLNSGCFTVFVDDNLPYTNGAWKVEYDNGRGIAEKADDNTVCDIKAAMPAFTQLVYGYDNYTADVAAYMNGVTVNNDNSDFFLAFQKKNNGLFEHF